MNVGKLKKFLENFSDETPVVVPVRDHRFQYAVFHETPIVKENSGRSGYHDIFSEPDFDEQNAIDAIVIE